MADNDNEKLAEVLEKQTKILERLEQKTVGNSQTAPMLHGNGGVFAGPGLEREVITAYVRPHGIGSVLRMIPSTVEDPRFASVTGYTDVVGSEPTTPCDDAPYGFIKGCNLTARFGMLRRDTNVIDIEKVMLKKNRGDFTDLVLMGSLLNPEMNLTPSGLNESEVLNVLTMSEMVGAGAQAERKMSKDLWQGTVAAGSFPGLDAQIATGQKDADTGTLCPALDSDVKDFNFDSVTGGGRDIVEYVSMMAFYLQYNAESMGLDPVSWVLVMKPELWYELSATWPDKYLTNRGRNLTSTAVVINDNVNIAMRDAMRNGNYIDINGKRYPVITDTGIYEYNNINNANCRAGEYASSIYFVPLTITGNYPVCYREYVDYRAWNRDASLLRGMQTFWTDDGIYSWAIDVNKWCFHLALKTEQRVVLRTPHLAGKIQRVKYVPLQHLREPYADSPYFKDGGVSVRGASWGQAVWA